MKIGHPRLHLIQGDLTDTTDAWEMYLPDSIDIVIHTAGLVHTYIAKDFFDINTDGTERLVNVLKKKMHSPLTFVLVSSLSAAGPSSKGQKKDLHEQDSPVSAYGLSKKYAENYLLKNKIPSWTSIIIRPPMVIGPRDTAVLDIFKMVRDGIILLPGLQSRKKEYSFVCVFDLVETIVRSLPLKQDFVCYSAHNSVITFEELIFAIQHEMKKKNIIFLPMPSFMVAGVAHLLAISHKIVPHQLRLTPDKIKELIPDAWTCDSSDAQEKLGQKFDFPLAATIKLTFEDYKKNALL
jgi:nucleoside-diphosphate-sugar epimerase